VLFLLERFLEAGFDAYLGKPFTGEQLRDVLMGVLHA
jgi:CheY-like chemotaxis protein